MINTKIIFRILGFLIGIEGLMMLGCSLVSLFYGGQEGDLLSFLVSAAIAFVAGALFYVRGRGAEKTFSRRDGYVIVSTSWVLFSLFGMLPFVISGFIPNITNAFFETMSGFTSTGATILDNIESLPHGLLFWRSLTQWIGGLGIVFFTIAVLPIFGVGGIQLFAAESTGPQKDKVHPRIGITAKWIWSVYVGMTLLETALLMLGGMSLFDSICHSFTTTSTGGYSTKQSSVAYFNSPYIEYVISIFMIISGVNFNLLLLGISGKLKKVFGNSELRWYLWSVFIFVGFIAIVLHNQCEMNSEQAFRLSLFQVASLHTSTGFATADYVLWPPVLWGALTLVMLMGACAGGTSGGIKSIRLLIMSKVAKNEFKHIIHPNAVLPVRVNRQVVSSSIQSTVLAFTFIYLGLIVISSLLLMFMGIGFEESIGCTISSIGNMGPGLGSFGPAFSWNAMPDVAKWILALLMLIGRLELFTVLLMFTPGFWKRA